MGDYALDWRNLDYEPVYQERIRRLANLRASPELLPGVKQFYKDHPVEFITDFGLTFDPRNVEVGLPATVPFIMFPRQAEFVDWVVERWRAREDGLAEKSRDMGVSWLCVAISVWMWLFHPGVVIGFGSRKESYVDDLSNPSALFWKIRMFVEYLPNELRPAGWDQKKHAPYMKILNPENGSSIVGEAGDNIGRGNRASIYFVDEAAFLERPDAIDAALSQTANCKIHVSTPNGAGNPFYRKRHGGKTKVFTFHWKEDPRKDDAWYRKQCESLDPVVVAQEIDISYSASVGDAFIPEPLVMEAQTKGPANVEALGPLIIGVDVARFGDDKSVITARQGRVVMWQRVFEKMDTMSLAAQVKAAVDAFRASGQQVAQIAVDTIGVGSGVADRLRMFYPDKIDGTGRVTDKSIVADVNSSLPVSDGVNFNLRAQMWDAGKQWLENAPVSLPNDPELRTDLTALKYKFKGGLRLIESKEDAKRRGIKSPDRADSLMLTFAIPCVERKRSLPQVTPFEPLDTAMGW
jgi:phage terminase large subunit